MRRRALLAGFPVLTGPGLIGPGLIGPGLIGPALSVSDGARAEEPLPVVRIGLLWDRAGPAGLADGPDHLVAARLAVADFGRLSRGYPVDVVSAAFDRRPDQAMAIARDWFEKERVAAIANLPGTAAAAMVRDLARARDRTVLNTGSISATLSGAGCSPTATQWLEDTDALTMAPVWALASEGVKTWFLVVPDEVTGLAFQAGATAAIEATGGRVVGFTRHATEDGGFTRALLNAGGSGAEAIGLCAQGDMLREQIRSARGMGLFERNRSIVAYGVTLNDIQALRDDEARGVLTAAAFYWNRNDLTRSFAYRFKTATERMPDRAHAATYVAVGHFLRAVETADTLDGATLNAGLRREPPWFFGSTGRFRADGRLLLDMGLYRVKPLDQVGTPWDHYKSLRIVPASQAFRPPERGRCVSSP